MLMPKKVKFRKQQRGSMAGAATRGNDFAFGKFAIKALEPGWITARSIEAARRAMTRYIKRGGQVWIRIFPDKPITKKPYASIFGPWDKARKDAGLGEVRLHDLRHGFASFLVNSGRTIYEVQKLLGHANIATTQRYAHLSQDTLLDATNAVSNTIGSFSNSISQSAIIPSSEITIG